MGIKIVRNKPTNSSLYPMTAGEVVPEISQKLIETDGREAGKGF